MKGYLLVAVFFIFISFASSSPTISGKATANVSIYIQDSSVIFIHSPLNITYNFQNEPYTLDLNVSAKVEIVEWRFSLYDLRHSNYVYSNVQFNPNSTFNATRWENQLTVYGKGTDGIWYSKQVMFFVNVSDSAPLLGPIDDNLFVCEEESMSYQFNATDEDEDNLNVDISPKNPFYVQGLGKDMNDLRVSFFEIFSGILSKSKVGNYTETVSVDDGIYSDSKKTNITVIEINNPPVLEDLGAQTVWTHGDNSTFFHQMNADDVEDGNSSDGKLGFNISFENGENLFSIDKFGVMNFTPLVSQVGVYNITVCVNDSELKNPNKNISLCYPQNGNSHSVCDDFMLSVTNQNRPPQILNYTPYGNVSVDGTSMASFFASVYDPDGIIPDINWYVDGVLKKHIDGKTNDTFNYIFGCEFSGTHYVEIITTDGLLNASHRWKVDVGFVPCPPQFAGGGGGGAAYCMEKWVCGDWDVCQNLERSHEIKSINDEDYYNSLELCKQEKIPEQFCGFQLKNCEDVNKCNYSSPKVPKPSEYQVCYFTENPNCIDGIKNCHDGGCELLVDCGGPCSPCPTCSDGIKNQGEEGVDCGGPCPYKCETEVPMQINWLLVSLVLFLIFIVVFIILKVRNIRALGN